MHGLLERNIGVGLHFTALHEHAFYRARRPASAPVLPHATRASGEILSLPLFPDMTRTDVDDVAAALEQTVRSHAA